MVKYVAASSSTRSRHVWRLNHRMVSINAKPLTVVERVPLSDTSRMNSLLQDLHGAGSEPFAAGRCSWRLPSLRSRSAWARPRQSSVIVGGVVLRPLPYRDPGELVAIWVTNPKFQHDAAVTIGWDRVPLGAYEGHDLERQSTVFQRIGFWSSGATTTLHERGSVERIQLMRASAGGLSTLGVSPVLGRGFLPGEDQLGGPKVALLSWERWRTYYGGDSNVIGREVHFEPRGTYTIVGVLPQSFAPDRAATIIPYWIPAGQDSTDLASNANHSYTAIGRLKPGVTIAQALPETERIITSSRNWTPKGARLVEWQRDMTAAIRAPMLVLLGAVSLLLLVACVNVAILAPQVRQPYAKGKWRPVSHWARRASGSRGRCLRKVSFSRSSEAHSDRFSRRRERAR